MKNVHSIRFPNHKSEIELVEASDTSGMTDTESDKSLIIESSRRE